jgi:hypothetical protein
MRGEREVYTPQVVVNGSAHVIGSDRSGIESAIDDTKKADGVMSVPVSMTLAGKQISVSVAASSTASAEAHGEVWICSISKAVPISIGRGENSGRQVTYYNVVRTLLKISDWNGSSGNWTVPLESISREGVDAAVVYVQDGNRDKPGAMLAGLHVALLKIPLLSFPKCNCTSWMCRREIHTPDRGLDPARSFQTRQYARPEGRSPKRKRTNSRWPRMGINYSCEQARSRRPRGLGAEESGAERTGPTQ